MSSPNQEDAIVSRYTESVRMPGVEDYAMGLQELKLIVEDSHRINTARLEHFTALQRALPAPRGNEHTLSSQQSHLRDLRDSLTNIIIMQSRLSEREKDFLELLKQNAENQIIEGVPMEPVVVGGWAKAILEARRRLG